MEKEKEQKKVGKVVQGIDSQSNSGIWQDERFQHLLEDPRFKHLPKTQRKVIIDKRFQGMFTNEKFNVKYTVDKYGRRVNKSNAEDLKKFYELDSDDEDDEDNEKTNVTEPKSIAVAKDDDDEDEEEKERRAEELAISRQSGEEDNFDNDALESDGEIVPETIKERLLDPNIDYARGEGRLVTDSSSDDESSDDDENDPELYIDHVWGELDAEAETTDESTRRLAVCNMDWDRIRAQDLMLLFSSFLPPGGSVLSVKIYPSEFGKERMAEEEVHGPTELVGLGKDGKKPTKPEADSSDYDSDEDLVQEQDSEAEEGDDYHMEKLRQYQLNRLRYYYAVVECDSAETSDKIYRECDGNEYESSATRVDLRFIPDDTTFDEDEPTDVCTELPDVSSYKPRQFTTTALQQAKVDLTWDETALERRELGDKLSSGKIEQVSDKDMRKIVAYSSEEEDDELEIKAEQPAVLDKLTKQPKEVTNEKKIGKKKVDIINKYKALLAEINENEQKEKNRKYEMELTWDVNESKETESPADTTNFKQELTPIEKVLQKRNEKNKKRKEERRRKKRGIDSMDPNAADNDSDNDSLPDGIDMQDPYFAEEFANGDFIDPKTKKKAKAKQQKEALEAEKAEQEKQAKELQLLLDDDDDEEAGGKQHFSLEKILKTEQEGKKKKKRRKQLMKSKSAANANTGDNKEVDDNFQINVADERFGAVYTSHVFNIDPTDSHFKKTKGMEQIIQEKLKRRHDDGVKQVDESSKTFESKRPKKHLENSLLVKSLKRKIGMKQRK